jgi:hypothetical protein
MVASFVRLAESLRLSAIFSALFAAHHSARCAAEASQSRKGVGWAVWGPRKVEDFFGQFKALLARTFNVS